MEWIRLDFCIPQKWPILLGEKLIISKLYKILRLEKDDFESISRSCRARMDIKWEMINVYSHACDTKKTLIRRNTRRDTITLYPRQGFISNGNVSSISPRMLQTYLSTFRHCAPHTLSCSPSDTPQKLENFSRFSRYPYPPPHRPSPRNFDFDHQRYFTNFLDPYWSRGSIFSLCYKHCCH